MMSFRGNRLENTTWPNTVLKLIGRIREYRGKQALYERQAPEVLESLKRAAIIQSIESSNRIEGITVSEKRLPLIVQGVQPQDRSEAEVAGYKDVLATIHASAPHIFLKPGVILQMHRDMMAYATRTGGRFKISDNVIKETLPSGEERIRFIPLPAWQTPDAVAELTDLYRQKCEEGKVDELILIGAFVLDFLCIHPFTDGNGRLSRLLTLLLLYQSGFDVGRYISIEKVIEETKDRYYESLARSSEDWHDGKHNLIPWFEYFLTMLLICYQRYEERVGIINTGQRGWKENQVVNTIEKLIGDFTISDIQERCPGISRPTIQRVLNLLGREGKIECLQKGRNARWRKR